MTTQTKCTLIICLLFIVEIFPLPFTAFISLYVIRKRPQWFPKVVENLYDNVEIDNLEEALANVDPMKTRSRCTYVLSAMTVFDLVIPVTIPTALFIARKRPQWFKKVATRLYYDIAETAPTESGSVPAELIKTVGQLDHRPEVAAAQLKKQMALEKENINFARKSAERSSIKSQRKQNEELAGS